MHFVESFKLLISMLEKLGITLCDHAAVLKRPVILVPTHLREWPLQDKYRSYSFLKNFQTRNREHQNKQQDKKRLLGW